MLIADPETRWPRVRTSSRRLYSPIFSCSCCGRLRPLFFIHLSFYHFIYGLKFFYVAKEVAERRPSPIDPDGQRLSSSGVDSLPHRCQRWPLSPRATKECKRYFYINLWDLAVDRSLRRRFLVVLTVEFLISLFAPSMP